MDYYEIPTWKDYQHYKDRDPPWIKLHFSLLSSPTWVMLDDASRVLAVACMLIASRNHGRVPANPEYVKRVAYLKGTPNFKPLIECGFLFCASTMLADASECKQKQANDTQRREEKSREKTLPNDFTPNQSNIDLAISLGINLEVEVEKFKDHHGSKGSKFVDWNRALNTWLRKSIDFGSASKVGSGVAVNPNLTESQRKAFAAM